MSLRLPTKDELTGLIVAWRVTRPNLTTGITSDPVIKAACDGKEWPLEAVTLSEKDLREEANAAGGYERTSHGRTSKNLMAALSYA